MKYYIYYHDDYCMCGGHGFKEFNNKKDALNFINIRKKVSTGNHEGGKYREYKIIEGVEVK